MHLAQVQRAVLCPRRLRRLICARATVSSEAFFDAARHKTQLFYEKCSKSIFFIYICNVRYYDIVQTFGIDIGCDRINNE